MRMLLQNSRRGTLEVAEVPAPLPRPEGVIVRTAASLISAGTERAFRELAKKSLVGKALARPDQARQVIEVARREGLSAARDRVAARLDVNRPLGYSAAGIVVAVGTEAAGDFTVGQAVACAGGGHANHAELIAVPRTLCAPVPAGVDLEAAACATVGAVALHGVRQAEARIGDRVAVIGLGLVGLFAVQILRAAGCAVIGVDRDPGRCQLAEDLGADRANPAGNEAEVAIRAWAPAGVDAVLLTADTPANDPIELAGAISRDRGRIVVVGAVGLAVPRAVFYRKELELRLSRSYGPGRYDPVYEERGIDYPIGYVRWTEGRNLAAFLDLVARGSVRVDRLITHRFPLDRAAEAYDLVEGRAGERPIGVLFTYPAAPAAATNRVDLAPAVHPPAGTPGIGLIGAGTFATAVLLPALRAAGGDRFHPRGIASLSGISARTTGRRFGFAFCATDPAAVTADPETDAVIVATRHDQHVPLTVAALAAGKAVFVEKPLALDRAGLAAVIAAVRASGRTVTVGFNRRFAPVTAAVRDHFAGRGEPIAVLCRVNAGYLPPDHWTQDPIAGGDRIRGEACHFVDLMHYLVGAPPVRVSAQALPNAGRYSGDNVTATIQFADGSIGTLLYLANGDAALPKERIEVSGGGRSAVIDDFREAILYPAGRARRVRPGGQDKGHRAEIAAWLAMLRHGGPPPIAFAEAVLSTLATLAIAESLATGGPVAVEPDAIGAAGPVEAES